jgi:hypothetical protein
LAGLHLKIICHLWKTEHTSLKRSLGEDKERERKGICLKCDHLRQNASLKPSWLENKGKGEEGLAAERRDLQHKERGGYKKLCRTSLKLSLGENEGKMGGEGGSAQNAICNKAYSVLERNTANFCFV